MDPNTRSTTPKKLTADLLKEIEDMEENLEFAEYDPDFEEVVSLKKSDRQKFNDTRYIFKSSRKPALGFNRKDLVEMIEEGVIIPFFPKEKDFVGQEV